MFKTSTVATISEKVATPNHSYEALYYTWASTPPRSQECFLCHADMSDKVITHIDEETSCDQSLQHECLNRDMAVQVPQTREPHCPDCCSLPLLRSEKERDPAVVFSDHTTEIIEQMSTCLIEDLHGSTQGEHDDTVTQLTEALNSLHLTEPLHSLHLVEPLRSMHLTKALNTMHLTEELNSMHLTEPLQSMHLTEALNSLHLTEPLHPNHNTFTTNIQTNNQITGPDLLRRYHSEIETTHHEVAARASRSKAQNTLTSPLMNNWDSTPRSWWIWDPGSRFAGRDWSADSGWAVGLGVTWLISWSVLFFGGGWVVLKIGLVVWDSRDYEPLWVGLWFGGFFKAGFTRLYLGRGLELGLRYLGSVGLVLVQYVGFVLVWVVCYALVGRVWDRLSRRFLDVFRIGVVRS